MRPTTRSSLCPIVSGCQNVSIPASRSPPGGAGNLMAARHRETCRGEGSPPSPRAPAIGRVAPVRNPSRHPSARSRHRHPHDPGVARASRSVDHSPLYPGRRHDDRQHDELVRPKPARFEPPRQSRHPAPVFTHIRLPCACGCAASSARCWRATARKASGGEAAQAEPAVEQFEHQPVAVIGQGRVVARPLVT